MTSEFEDIQFQPDDGVGVRFKRDVDAAGRSFRARTHATLTVEEARDVVRRSRGGFLRRATRAIFGGSTPEAPIDLTDATPEERREIFGTEVK